MWGHLGGNQIMAYDCSAMTTITWFCCPENLNMTGNPVWQISVGPCEQGCGVNFQFISTEWSWVELDYKYWFKLEYENSIPFLWFQFFLIQWLQLILLKHSKFECFDASSSILCFPSIVVFNLSGMSPAGGLHYMVFLSNRYAPCFFMLRAPFACYSE